MNEPKQIEASPRSHSHLYELKPLHKGWFFVSLTYAVLLAAANVYVAQAFSLGWANPITWCLLMSGGMVAASAFLCFPATWLSKLDN